VQGQKPKHAQILGNAGERDLVSGFSFKPATLSLTVENRTKQGGTYLNLSNRNSRLR
jgi:hypothetical protein